MVSKHGPTELVFQTDPAITYVSQWFPSMFQTPEVFWSAVTLPAEILCLLSSIGDSFEAGHLSYSIAKKNIPRKWKLKNMKRTFSVLILRGFFRIKIWNL